MAGANHDGDAGGPLERLSALLRRAQGSRRQADIVKDTGLSKATVSNALRGRVVPSEVTLEALSRTLEMSDADIVEVFRLRKAAAPLERRLASYLQAARIAAQEHPYPGVLPGTVPPLAAVYLSQHVSQADALETGRRTAAEKGPVRGRGALGSIDAGHTDVRSMAQRDWRIPQDADEALSASRSSVILAGPGGGKSSLLRTLLTENVERWIRTHEGSCVAVLVSASDLVDRPLAQAVASAVNKDLAPYGLVDELPAEFFAAPVQHASTAADAPAPSAEWWVLVDGFDEITDRAARRRVLRLIATINAEASHLYRFILATRPLPVGELGMLPPDVPCYDLLPFRPDDVETVAGGWFRALAVPAPEATAETFCLALARTTLMELARIPLMIAMLCQIHAADPDRSLPAGRGHIYTRFAELLNERQHEARRAALVAQRGPDLHHYPGAHEVTEKTLTSLNDLVTHLAAQRYAGNLSPSLDIIESHPSARRPLNVPAAVWRDYLYTNLSRTGLVSGRGGELVFLHQTLLEYLAALHVRADAAAVDLSFADVFAAVSESDGDSVNSLRVVSEASFIGFLIDCGAPELIVKKLTRLSSRFGGLPGCEFVAQQVQLGTCVPQEVLRAAADRCAAIAGFTADEVRTSRQKEVATSLFHGVRRSRSAKQLGIPLQPGVQETLTRDNLRYRAAVALVQLGDARGQEMLVSIAADGAVDANNRLRSLKRLLEMDAPELVALIKKMISDCGNPGWFRVSCTEILVGYDAPQGTDALMILAGDPELAARSRIAAANVLVRLGEARGLELLGSMATDQGLDSGSRRRAAKSVIADRGRSQGRGLGSTAVDLPTAAVDDAASDILHLLATDQSLDVRCRLEAADLLSDLDEVRGPDAWNLLSLGGDIEAKHRVRAAGRLVERQDDRGPQRLAELAEDGSIGHWHRLRATELLAQVDEVRAKTLLHSLATAERIEPKVRANAAMLLARLGDAQNIELLIAVALDPQYDGNSRLDAASLMVELRDKRGLHLLSKLARDATIDRWFRNRAAQLVAGERALQSPELLYTMAHDQSLHSATLGTAEALAGMGDRRGADILAALAGRRSVDIRNRLDAAEVLADLRDPRAPDLLFALASDRLLRNAGAKVEAAKVLASLEDPRGLTLLNDFATRRFLFARSHRWQADVALEDLGVQLPKAHYFLYFFRRRITTPEKIAD